MRKIVIAFLVLLSFVLQGTLMQWISLGGIVPNLLIIMTSAYGFMRGKKNGLLVGFFCGLLTDIFFGEVIGFYAIIYMYIGYANGMFHRVFFPEDIKLPLFLITVSDLAYGFAVYVLLYLLRGRFGLPYYFLHVIVPEMVYTIVLTLLCYPVHLKINRKFDEIEKRSEKKFV
ncbi:MAG: rod shape-determining protein MreD [Lachnospiraceae bacterium]|nr:rod shape-determining protein MreD [Lachnospiraceae bacterium]MDE7240142.1 rod shape-determining protein MreD [Lachnospiraceae bacterium]